MGYQPISMCGISGLVHHDRHRPVHLEDLQRMCATLIHRGTDDEGFFVDQNVGLGMRRLNVIDLVTGHQPISNEDGRLWIVFNGEIYPGLFIDMKYRAGTKHSKHKISVGAGFIPALLPELVLVKVGSALVKEP